MATNNNAPAKEKTDRQKAKDAIANLGYGSYDALIRHVALDIEPDYDTLKKGARRSIRKDATNIVRNYINDNWRDVNRNLFAIAEHGTPQQLQEAYDYWKVQWRVVKSGLKQSKDITIDDWRSIRKLTKAISDAMRENAARYGAAEDTLVHTKNTTMAVVKIEDFLIHMP